MREIKFRAWDKKNKLMFCIFDNITQEDWFLPNWKSKYEVMQYTGLKDINNVEIYEGDIIKTRENQSSKGEIFEIFYQHGSFWLFNKNHKGFELWRQCNFSNGIDTGTTWFEIIGNIYKNPELLKEGK